MAEPSAKKKILVVDDERGLVRIIRLNLEHDGFEVVEANNGAQAIDKLRTALPDLVLLDVMMPDLDGFTVLKTIREVGSTPVIMLTAKGEEDDRVKGLELGADDYVTKPFSPRELGARIKTVLRRSAPIGAERDGPADREPVLDQTPDRPDRAPEHANDAEAAALRIDSDKMQAVYRGRRLELTRYEFRLLAVLAERPGRVLSREALMRRVWDDDSPSLDRTVDAHVKSLRAKFRDVEPSVDPIVTHRGTGYALRDDLETP